MFISGLLTGWFSFIFTYALFSGSKEEELESVQYEEESDVIVNDGSGRLHTLYCESCRKKKRHREIVPRKFECTRCRRITDLRIPS
jgi:hypothetical protein